MTAEIRQNVVYRDSEPVFAIERQDNCVALIPMHIYSDLLDEEAFEIQKILDGRTKS